MTRNKQLALGLFVPMLPLLAWCVLEISLKVPASDRLTMHMPYFWRKQVSATIFEDDFPRKPASHTAMERVVKLDPANTDGWKRRCLWAGSTGDAHKDVSICEKAVAEEPNSVILVSALAKAQMAAGDACSAEKMYERAAALYDDVTLYVDLALMAQAARQCGDLEKARRGLEAAIRVEERNRAFSKEMTGKDAKVEREDEERDRKMLSNLPIPEQGRK